MGKTIHVQKNGFQEIFNVVMNNSIVGFDHNENKLLLQISLKCIWIIFVPIVLCLSLICGQTNFKNPKSRIVKYMKQFEIH